MTSRASGAMGRMPVFCRNVSLTLFCSWNKAWEERAARCELDSDDMDSLLGPGPYPMAARFCI